MMTHTYTRPYPRLIALHNIYFSHVYRSVSLARMRRYTQLAHLFHQCATSLLSRDSRIADCTVRHPGVERPFSSLVSNTVLKPYFSYTRCFLINNKIVLNVPNIKRMYAFRYLYFYYNAGEYMRRRNDL